MMQCAAILPEHSGKHVAGTDEAGRGPLAGAVYAAAVILPARYELPGLNDSKKLSAKRRELLFDQIMTQAVCFAITGIPAAEIDRINIFQASLLGMKKAVTALVTQPDFVYVDGKHCPDWTYASTPLVGGDSKMDAVAAASILAKVARDREMARLDALYPGYGFAAHKGYPTKAHFAALKQLGPCPEHRRSFAPVAACLDTLGSIGVERAVATTITSNIW